MSEKNVVKSCQSVDNVIENFTMDWMVATLETGVNKVTLYLDFQIYVGLLGRFNRWLHLFGLKSI